MAKYGGWAGKVLHVDLSTGRASEGTWILFAGDEFVSLDDETFTALFTEAT